MLYPCGWKFCLTRRKPRTVGCSRKILLWVPFEFAFLLRAHPFCKLHNFIIPLPNLMNHCFINWKPSSKFSVFVLHFPTYPSQKNFICSWIELMLIKLHGHLQSNRYTFLWSPLPLIFLWNHHGHLQRNRFFHTLSLSILFLQPSPHRLHLVRRNKKKGSIDGVVSTWSHMTLPLLTQ